MTGIEIVLIFAGVVAIAASFIFSQRFEKADKKSGELIERTEETIAKKADDTIDGLSDEKLEPTEVRIEKLMNEKKNNNNERILQMHKEGSSSLDIARKLGIGIGEVRLVINLYENR